MNEHELDHPLPAPKKSGGGFGFAEGDRNQKCISHFVLHEKRGKGEKSFIYYSRQGK